MTRDPLKTHGCQREFFQGPDACRSADLFHERLTSVCVHARACVSVCVCVLQAHWEGSFSLMLALQHAALSWLTARRLHLAPLPAPQ